MDGFGKYLKLLLEKNGETVTSLSKKSGVERTSIHKAIKGERVLSYISLKKIENSLCLTTQEKLILQEYYDVGLQGENLFVLRKMMIDVLNNLAEECSDQNKKIFDTAIQTGDNASDWDKEMSCYKGVSEIILAIRKMIDREAAEEKPEMLLYLPGNDNLLTQYLRLLFMQYEINMQVTHLCPYILGEKRKSILNALNGISQLKYAVDLAVMSGGKYQYLISYHSEKAQTPFPWYIITSGEVMMISDGWTKQACLIRQKDMVRLFRNQFQQERQASIPYIKVCNTIENANGFLLEQVEADLGKVYVIAEQAGLSGYMPVKVEKENQIVWERTPKEYFGGFYFSRSGIRRFMENGILEGVPKEFQSSFSVKEREQILTAVLKDMREGRFSGRIVNEDRYRIAEGLQIFVIENQPVRILLEQKEYRYFVQIDEIYARKAFWDFAEYLSRSEEVESREDTLAFLQECINQLREK